MGDEVDPASLVRLAPLETTRRREDDGRIALRAPVTWVDRFGNVQLAVLELDGPPPAAGRLSVRIAGKELGARRVRSFFDLAEGELGVLAEGELGVLADANGRLAVVVREGSAAGKTELQAGGAVELIW